MVTVPPPVAHERLGDQHFQANKIGPEHTSMRGAHLNELTPVETLVRAAAPLYASYDVNRQQQPYFSEFTYTECLGGGLLVSPQSVEASARLVQIALDRPDQGFDAASAVVEQRTARGTLDKYKLNTSEPPKAKAVAFLPGHNIFRDAVSHENLARAMSDDDELVLKPHPLSAPALIRELCGIFGHHRVLHPMISGDACLMAAERVYAATTTEMGLYAILLGKPVRNIGNFFTEGRGAYSALYRPLWGKTPADAKAILTHALNSPFSGFMHKNDPNLSARIETYFAAAMDLRATLKPMFPPVLPSPPPGPAQAPPRPK